GKNIWRDIYSPFYPFVLYSLTVPPFLSLFQAAQLLVLIQYGLALYFLYRWTKTTSLHYRFNQNKGSLFLLVILILYHSWWSFRITTWAHADASFYCLLIMWGYFLSRCDLEGKRMQLVILSMLGALMIWVKLNALVFIPFYVLLLVFGKSPKKWLVPLCFTLLSYGCYR